MALAIARPVGAAARRFRGVEFVAICRLRVSRERHRLNGDVRVLHRREQMFARELERLLVAGLVAFFDRHALAAIDEQRDGAARRRRRLFGNPGRSRDEEHQHQQWNRPECRQHGGAAVCHPTPPMCQRRDDERRDDQRQADLPAEREVEREGSVLTARLVGMTNGEGRMTKKLEARMTKGASDS